MVTRPHHYDSTNKLWLNQLPSHSVLVDRTETKRTEKCEETRPFLWRRKLILPIWSWPTKAVFLKHFPRINNPLFGFVIHLYGHIETPNISPYLTLLESHYKASSNFNYIRLITTNTLNLREWWWWTINVQVWNWSKEFVCAQAMFSP